MSRRTLLATFTAVTTATALLLPVSTAQADPRAVSKDPVRTGFGGAVSTVDPTATKVGVEVLRRGGNAVDAAIAAAATLGVTEPFSSGIGGGGFFVHYDAATGAVRTIDGREEAPAAMPQDAFVDPATGEPYPFYPQRVTGGVSVGVPGTLATWQRALEQWGSTDLSEALRPATKVADRGFKVDQTFHDQIAKNQPRFELFPASRELWLPGGAPPEVGSVFRNHDLAKTYRLISREGIDALYEGPISDELVQTVRDPQVDRPTELPVPPGYMTAEDLAGYRTLAPEPTRIGYRGLDIYGMAPPSSGGSTVGEALNILEGSDLGALPRERALHRYLESTALAFADRNAYVGDDRYVDVPLDELLSDGFAGERACRIEPRQALPKPVDPGSPDGSYTGCDSPGGGAKATPKHISSTTHLNVADRWGNVVSYTLTIEQIGGSGMTVPGWGFVLNNELTDFTADPEAGGPNLVAGGKRPRSSMAPTIVLQDGEPKMALGTPGGTTIITTVAQILVNRIDLGMSLPEALAAPRASQRNRTDVLAEPAFIAEHGDALRGFGHTFETTGEIGAATGIEFLGDGLMQAAAEPQRRGGGDAGVAFPLPAGP